MLSAASSSFPDAAAAARPGPGGRLLVLLLLVVYATLVLRTGWIGDDAYITFRTAANLVEGRGLTWNDGERVQAYTHPLWMFLTAGGYAITGEFFLAVLLGSVLISITAAAIVVLLVLDATAARVAALVVLILSKSFVDYSTAGLENPLTHLLIALLAWRLRRGGAATGSDWISGLLVCALGLTRLDLLLVAAPLVLAGMRAGGWRGIARLAVALIPLGLWLLWASYYYGSPFPNTAYAKLNNGVPRAELLWQGLIYCVDLLQRDPLAAAVILAGVLCPLISRDRLTVAFASAAALHLGYVVWIGGDFMAGRLFSTPLLLAVLTIGRLPGLRAVHHVVIAVIAAVVGVANPNCPLYTFQDFGADVDFVAETGIADERAFYYRFASLPQFLRTRAQPNHEFVAAGLAAARARDAVVPRESIGYFGFFAGPRVYVLDQNALTDPLLARLRPVPAARWRIGHFKRALPEGYLETLVSGENRLSDPDLAAYYDVLTRVTRGPLWRADRLRDIVALHTSAAARLAAYQQRVDQAAPRRSALQSRPRSGPRGRGASRGALPPAGRPADTVAGLR